MPSFLEEIIPRLRRDFAKRGMEAEGEVFICDLRERKARRVAGQSSETSQVCADVEAR